MGIKEEMPLLARHEGVWEGTYIYVDRDGQIIDQHASTVTCSFPQDGEFDYRQLNEYSWSDGKTQTLDFPAIHVDGEIRFDTNRLKGHAWEVDHRTILLTWVYQGEEDLFLYEMIHLSADGNHRARTWHWFVDDELDRRTLIKETRVDGSSD